MTSTVTMNSGHMAQILRIAEAKGMTPARMTKLLASGLMDDIMDVRLDLDIRGYVNASLNMSAILSTPIPFMLVPDDEGNANAEKEAVAYEAQIFYFGLENGKLSKKAADMVMMMSDMEKPWRSAGSTHLDALTHLLPKEDKLVQYIALSAGGKNGQGNFVRSDFCVLPDGERFWLGVSIEKDGSFRYKDEATRPCRYIGVRRA